MFRRLIASLTPSAMCKHSNSAVFTSPHLGVHFDLKDILLFHSECENELQRWLHLGYDYYTVRHERLYCYDCKEYVGPVTDKVESVYNSATAKWYGAQPGYTIEVPSGGIPPVEGRHVYGDLFRRIGVSLNDAEYSTSDSPLETTPKNHANIALAREHAKTMQLGFLFVDHILLEVWVCGTRFMEWEFGEPRGVLFDDALKHRAMRSK